jgi:hypothetical protein
MWELLQGQIIPGITAGAVAAGIVVFLFKTYISHWINSRFSNELERFRLEASIVISRTNIL